MHLRIKHSILIFTCFFCAPFVFSNNTGLTVSITKYGAIGNGVQVNTSAIQSAVDECADSGGGIIIIPSGVYVTGTIELKSNIHLYLSPGAILRGSSNINDYIPNPFYHNEFKKTTSLLWAISQSNITISGEGIIDLNDSNFIDFSQFKMDFGMGTGVSLNERQREESTAKDMERPTQPLFFQDCKHLTLKDFTIKNSPCWTISFHASNDIKINGLTILNNLRTPNSDGIHCCGCKNVIITNSTFICGDDCVAITGITDWNKISEKIIIANCYMTSRSAAIRIGHEASKVKDVNINNIIISDSNRGVAIFAGKGGSIENVLITNIIADTRIIAGAWWGKGEPLVIAANENARISNITVSNVHTTSDNGIILYSDKSTIQNISLSDWNMELRFGNNRMLFKNLYDVLPIKPFVSPEPKNHIPWLFASEINKLYINNVRYWRKNDDVNFSMLPLTNGKTKLYLNNCKELE